MAEIKKCIVRLGDVVSTDFGTGRVVAMSREWCVVETHPDHKKDRECAVPWRDVWVEPVAESAQSVTQEMALAAMKKEGK